jgi:hypothetical protein
MTQWEINDLREPRNAKNCVMSGITYLTCQSRRKVTRLAAKPVRKHSRVGNSLRRDSCQSVRARPCSNGCLDHRAELDGNGVPSQCKAVRTHPLPLHWPLLSRDDRAGRFAWFWHGLGLHFRLVASSRCQSPWEHAPLVGNRAGLGQILLRQKMRASLVCASSASGAKRKCRRRRLPAAIGGIPEIKCSI